eukprot:9483603-Pyramimonas_sp.AAC.1
MGDAYKKALINISSATAPPEEAAQSQSNRARPVDRIRATLEENVEVDRLFDQPAPPPPPPSMPDEGGESA